MVVIRSSAESFPGILIAGDLQKGHGFIVLCWNKVRLPLTSFHCSEEGLWWTKI